MKVVFFIGMFIFSQTLYSQKNMLSDFKLLYSIPQEVKETDEWPKYTLESLFLENDTLYTLLVKKGNITAIPLSGTVSGITQMPIPVNDFPLFLKRYQGIWYTASVRSIMKILSPVQCQKIIAVSESCILNFFDILKDKIIYANRDVSVVMTDMDGKELKRVPYYYYLLYSFVYENRLVNGRNDVVVDGNSFSLATQHTYTPVYKYENVFVGGCGEYGYFVDYDHRDHIVVRNMTNTSLEEVIYFNHVFSVQDLGFQEEDEINLRVFSEDNRIFYFVQVKNGHLDIYRGIR